MNLLSILSFKSKRLLPRKVGGRVVAFPLGNFASAQWLDSESCAHGDSHRTMRPMNYSLN
jgi:hypothetical protein